LSVIVTALDFVLLWGVFSHGCCEFVASIVQLIVWKESSQYDSLCVSIHSLPVLLQ